MLDADLKRFANGLHETRPGLRLRLAMHEGRIAIQQIGRLQALNNPRNRAAIESWRQAYQTACRHASQAIDLLWDEHQWPADSGRDRRFEWKPQPRDARPRL